MNPENPEYGDTELDTQLILLASTHHNVEALRTLLRKGSANVQDPDTGFTPLHSAVAACESSASSSPTNANSIASPPLSNGHADEEKINGSIPTLDGADKLAAAAKTMKLLLQYGAIWNDLDKTNETPGCLALRLGFSDLYAIMVDAGIRAEMLLNRLDEYEALRDDDDDEVENEEEPVESTELGETKENGISEAVQTTRDSPTTEAHDDSTPGTTSRDVNSEDFLRSDLTFSRDRLLDADSNGVMMAWEADIMQRTTDLIVPKTGLRILNIGHGMGIIDSLFQTKVPSSHHIVEAHPTVINRMKKDSWYQKPNVVVHEGKWQDVIPKMIEDNILFDAIYFDTFAEDYKSLREFFSEFVIGLLDEGGKWGFFNGLGADRQICYDVYKAVCEMDLFEAGYEVEWETLEVPDLERNGAWKGVRRPYFALKEYKLPICTFIG